VTVERQSTPPLSPDIKSKSQVQENKTKAKSYDPNELRDFRRQFSSVQGVVHVEPQGTPPLSPENKPKLQNDKIETENVETIEVKMNGNDESSENDTPVKVVEIPIVCESDDTSIVAADDNANEDDKDHDSIFITSITEDIPKENEGITPEKETSENVETINFVGDIDHDTEDKEEVNIKIEKETCIDQLEEPNNVETKVEETNTLDKNVDEEGFIHIPIVVENNHTETTDSVKVDKDLDNNDCVESTVVSKEDTTNINDIEDSIISPYLESQKKPEAEKKKSFIKQWQEELKDFFSKGDKKDKKNSTTTANEKKKETVDENKKKIESQKDKSKKSTVVSEDDPKLKNKKKGGETEIESPKSKGKNKEKKISQSEDGDKTEPTLQEIERSKRLQRKQMQESDELNDNRKSQGFRSGPNKPRVVVPSPKGIPRPEPISRITEASARISTDSLSDDEFFVTDSSKGRAHSIEESEEFRKAVDSFEEIYRSESGHQIMKTTKTSEKSGHKETFEALEVDQIKNVDGASRERKGSNKLTKKRQQSRPGSIASRPDSQQSRPDSAASGSRYSACSAEEQDSERVSPDLTTRLAETKDQMQRLESSFRNLVDVEDEEISEHFTSTKLRETKGHSVTRTTVARTEDPLDQAIETMITKSTQDGVVVYEAKVSLFPPNMKKD